MRSLVYSDSLNSHYKIFAKPSSVDVVIFIIGYGIPGTVRYSEKDEAVLYYTPIDHVLDFDNIKEACAQCLGINIIIVSFMAYIEPGTTYLCKSRPLTCERAICIVGDTHHLRAPISFLRSIALLGIFDEYYFYCTPHHAIFISDITSNIYLFPPDYPKPKLPGSFNPWSTANLSVATYGDLNSPFHPRRSTLHNFLLKANEVNSFNYIHHNSTDYETWVHNLNQTAISIIQPMCSQLTPQISAALASYTIPLIERIPTIGLSVLGFTEVEDYLFYDSYDDLYKKICFLLNNPDSLKKIARSGMKKAYRSMVEQKEVDIKTSILENKCNSFAKINVEFNGDSFAASFIHPYEYIQDKARYGIRVNLTEVPSSLAELAQSHFPYVYGLNNTCT